MKHSIKNASLSKCLTLKPRNGRQKLQYFRVKITDTDGKTHIFENVAEDADWAAEYAAGEAISQGYFFEDIRVRQETLYISDKK